MRTLTPILALTLLAAACDRGLGPVGGEDGPTRVLLTDAPFPYDDVARVDIYVVGIWVATSADTTGPQDWIPVSEPRRVINLLDLHGGITTQLGSSDVRFAVWAAVRMAIDTDSSSITMVDGRQAAIQWGRAGVHALHATVYQPLVNWADDQGDIVIDFDVGRSFVPADDLGIDADFVFLPHIRAVNARATATIDGTVRDGAGPAPGAIVYAHRIFGEEAVVLAATAHAGTDGRYTLAFLDAGDYLIEARRAARGAVSAFAPVVTVLMGDRRTVDLALPGDSAGPALVVWGPSLIAVGDTVLFHARAVDAQGDSVASPSVGWTSSNAAAAGVIGEGAAPRVAGRAVGSSWIVGRWNGMGDSVLLNVAASTDTTGYR